MSPTVWCNARFGPEAAERLRAGLGGARLILDDRAEGSVLAAGRSDPALAEADVAFGQPDPDDCRRLARLRWVQLSSAGYTRYDTDGLREDFLARGAALTNSSSVFAEPCAQHVLAMMLALGRNLLPAYQDQLGERAWRFDACRVDARLLAGDTVLLLGYGAIGRRLAELLAPFRVVLYAVRRRTQSEPGVRIVSEADLTRVLPLADHVVDLLPEHETTRHWVNARRLACCRPGAKFYNVGRGATVDQRALEEALRSGRLGAAYLDVTEPEPLPPEHPLWAAPNCFITPHSAGGRRDQDDALVRHFLGNFAAFSRGEPLADRIV